MKCGRCSPSFVIKVAYRYVVGTLPIKVSPMILNSESKIIIDSSLDQPGIPSYIEFNSANL